jgi:transposase-like protein
MLSAMISDQIKLLGQLKAQAARLEAGLAAQRRAALAALPGQYGYPNLAAFIRALKQAAGARPRAKTMGKPAPAPVRSHPRISPEIKAAVKAAFEAGGTGQAVAREFGISFSSAQNLKKAFGLTRARSRATVQPVTLAPPPPAAAIPPPPDLAPAEIPVLVAGAEIEFRHQLAAELARTLVKLGDTKLKPFEWRSWREHEKKIRAAAVGQVSLPD